MLAFIKTLPLTFYSAPFYANLCRRSRGLGLGFLLIASLLGLGQAAVHYAFPIKSLWKERTAIFESLPPVTIQNGQLSIDAPSPLTLTFLEGKEGGPFKLVFDMEADSSDTNKIAKRMDDESLFLLATRDKIFLYDKSTARVEATSVSTMKRTTISHENWIEAGKLFSVFVPLSISFSMGLLLFLGHFVTALAGALGLYVLMPLLKLDLPFSALFRLAAAAKIPVGVLFLIVPPNPLIQLPLWLGFALFGLLASRQAA